MIEVTVGITFITIPFLLRINQGTNLANIIFSISQFFALVFNVWRKWRCNSLKEAISDPRISRLDIFRQFFCRWKMNNIKTHRLYGTECDLWCCGSDKKNIWENVRFGDSRVLEVWFRLFKFQTHSIQISKMELRYVKSFSRGLTDLN